MSGILCVDDAAQASAQPCEGKAARDYANQRGPDESAKRDAREACDSIHRKEGKGRHQTQEEQIIKGIFFKTM